MLAVKASCQVAGHRCAHAHTRTHTCPLPTKDALPPLRLNEDAKWTDQCPSRMLAAKELQE